MSLALKLVLAFLAAIPVAAGFVYYNSNLSSDNWTYQGQGHWKDSGYHGAPGPIVGAGLPVALIVGGGYWVVRRMRRKKPE
jgi:hypothetical protein